MFRIPFLVVFWMIAAALADTRPYSALGILVTGSIIYWTWTIIDET